ncbi:MAG TPA: hypothetical protein VN868_09815, partial [Terriglobales bacterium]|nr:hypothetical protein [Terriglobales bacterium]
MTKELFVSSTPHETKVGMVEDDLLAEIYLERENEYTLAGSIYKGRVTRVLPGMQSAFVDIGLERDAFLYVSDFMELEDADEVEEVPTNRPMLERYQPPQAETHPVETAAPSAAEPRAQEPGEAAPLAIRESSVPSESQDNRGGFRGRRRRRGRRGERFAAAKFTHSPAESPREAPRAERSERPERGQRPERSDRHDRPEYGPPPGYQPIILPGESISKYQRLAQSRPAPQAGRPASSLPEPGVSLAEVFSDDEPIFASTVPEPLKEVQAELMAQAGEEGESDVSSDWDREPKRQHQMKVAAVFGGEAAAEEAEKIDQDDRMNAVPQHSDQPPAAAPARTMEEEEIEEEEADLSHYVEELEEDTAFEELEEETHAAGEEHGTTHEIAASAEPSASQAVPFSAEPVSPEAVDVAGAEEVDEEAEQEAELDEAQAEAEAALAAEAGGGG